MKYSFKISTVIPVYNTEEYLQETIESVIHQSIGFSNIQMILVNNGTEDNAETICLDYQRRYPNNITYIKLDVNNGPCAARNAGMSIAEGKYINFLDSDDKWEIDAYEKAYRFFEEHYNEIDIVACRIRYFEAMNKWHGLDCKFDDGNQIVNVKEKYEYVQLSICSTLIKRQAIQDIYHDERVRHAEDAKFVNELILKKLRYGLVRDAVFFYRQRNSGNSTLQNVVHSSNWYVETMDYVYQYLVNESIRLHKTVIKYIQFLIMYELQWRIPRELPAEFTNVQRQKYLDRIRNLLQYIDDEVIFQQKSLWIEYKLYCYELKNKEKAELSELVAKMCDFYKCTYIDSIWYEEGKIHITGFVRTYKNNEIGNVSVYAGDNIPVNMEVKNLDTTRQVYAFGEQVTQGKQFAIDVMSDGISKVKFEVEINNCLTRQQVYVFNSAKINVKYIKENEVMTIIVGSERG